MRFEEVMNTIDGQPVYQIPDDAIPNGGWLLVNGHQIFISSERRLKEREAAALRSIDDMAHPWKPLWRWLHRLFS